MVFYRIMWDAFLCFPISPKGCPSRMPAEWPDTSSSFRDIFFSLDLKVYDESKDCILPIHHRTRRIYLSCHSTDTWHRSEPAHSENVQS